MEKQTEVEKIPSESKMAALLANHKFSPRPLSRGETVEGEIVAILHDSVLLDVGAKAEGMIPRKELEETKEKIEVGEKISAVIVHPEGDSGVVILTIKKSPREKVWSDLQEAYDKNETTEVKGIDSNRGGLIVEHPSKVRGFIPSSHLITDIKEASGRKLQVKIIELARDQNKLVFSEKEAAPENLPKIELPFKISDTLKVKISKILPFGLLVSLPSNTEGLIHISEISWKRVTDLTVNYKVGQELSAKVISIDLETSRVNLSIKQLEEDPWVTAAKKYQVGSVHQVKVSRTASYGVFVQLEEGIEGLIHSSKIPYGLELKAGEIVKVSIDLFNNDQRRAALRLAPEDEVKENKESEKKVAKAKSKKVKEAHSASSKSEK